MVESREKIFQVLTNEFSELSKEEADQMLDDFAVDVIKALLIANVANVANILFKEIK